jgi:16S rRNA processing protein RimM
LKSIRKEDFRTLGTVAKLHGTKGELKIQIEAPVKLKEWVFLLIKGKPVPFFVEEQKGNIEEPIVRLRHIFNADEASAFIGKSVLGLGKEKKQKSSSNDSLIGFHIFDSKNRDLGAILDILEMPQQLLAQLHYQNQEVLIPLAEDWILSLNPGKKQIVMKIPDGLLPD